MINLKEYNLIIGADGTFIVNPPDINLKQFENNSVFKIITNALLSDESAGVIELNFTQADGTEYPRQYATLSDEVYTYNEVEYQVFKWRLNQDLTLIAPNDINYISLTIACKDYDSTIFTTTPIDISITKTTGNSEVIYDANSVESLSADMNDLSNKLNKANIAITNVDKRVDFTKVKAVLADMYQFTPEFNANLKVGDQVIVLKDNGNGNNTTIYAVASIVGTSVTWNNLGMVNDTFYKEFIAYKETMDSTFASQEELNEIIEDIPKQIEDNNMVQRVESDGTYANTVKFEYDNQTGNLTAKLSNPKGEVISTTSINLPTEDIVVSGRYEASSKSIILTLIDEGTISIPVADLVGGLASETYVNQKVEDEALSRVGADNSLDAKITAEANARVSSDSALSTEIGKRLLITEVGKSVAPLDENGKIPLIYLYEGQVVITNTTTVFDTALNKNQAEINQELQPFQPFNYTSITASENTASDVEIENGSTEEVLEWGGYTEKSKNLMSLDWENISVVNGSVTVNDDKTCEFNSAGYFFVFDKEKQTLLINGKRTLGQGFTVTIPYINEPQFKDKKFYGKFKPISGKIVDDEGLEITVSYGVYFTPTSQMDFVTGRNHVINGGSTNYGAFRFLNGSVYNHTYENVLIEFFMAESEIEIPFEPYYEGFKHNLATSFINTGNNLFNQDKVLQEIGFTKQGDEYYALANDVDNNQIIFRNESKSTGIFYFKFDVKHIISISNIKGTIFVCKYTDGTVSYVSLGDTTGNYTSVMATSANGKILDYVYTNRATGGTTTYFKNFSISFQDTPYEPYEEHQYTLPNEVTSLPQFQNLKYNFEDNIGNKFIRNYDSDNDAIVETYQITKFNDFQYSAQQEVEDGYIRFEIIATNLVSSEMDNYSAYSSYFEQIVDSTKGAEHFYNEKNKIYLFINSNVASNQTELFNFLFENSVEFLIKRNTPIVTLIPKIIKYTNIAFNDGLSYTTNGELLYKKSTFKQDLNLEVKVLTDEVVALKTELLEVRGISNENSQKLFEVFSKSFGVQIPFEYDGSSIYTLSIDRQKLIGLHSLEIDKPYKWEINLISYGIENMIVNDDAPMLFNQGTLILKNDGTVDISGYFNERGYIGWSSYTSLTLSLTAFASLDIKFKITEI